MITQCLGQGTGRVSCELGRRDLNQAIPIRQKRILSIGGEYCLKGSRAKGKEQRAKGKGLQGPRAKGCSKRLVSIFRSGSARSSLTTCCPLPVIFGFLALRACTTLLSPAKPLLHNTLQSGSLSKSLFCAMFFANPCSAATLISVKRTSVNNRNHLFTNTTSVAGGRMIISSIKGRLDEGLVDPLFSPRGL